ncbi:hypothetical protein E2562_034050, partial [Oryza meyeriana var. granulata]
MALGATRKPGMRRVQWRSGEAMALGGIPGRGAARISRRGDGGTADLPTGKPGGHACGADGADGRHGRLHERGGNMARLAAVAAC